MCDIHVHVRCMCVCVFANGVEEILTALSFFSLLPPPTISPLPPSFPPSISLSTGVYWSLRAHIPAAVHSRRPKSYQLWRRHLLLGLSSTTSPLPLLPSLHHGHPSHPPNQHAVRLSSQGPACPYQLRASEGTYVHSTTGCSVREED